MYISASVEMTAHKRIGDIESQHSIRYTPLDLFGIRQSTDSLYDLHVHRRVILLLCGMIAMSINRFKLNIEIELWDVSVSTGGQNEITTTIDFVFQYFFLVLNVARLSFHRCRAHACVTFRLNVMNDGFRKMWWTIWNSRWPNELIFVSLQK